MDMSADIISKSMLLLFWLVCLCGLDGGCSALAMGRPWPVHGTDMRRYNPCLSTFTKISLSLVGWFAKVCVLYPVEPTFKLWARNCTGVDPFLLSFPPHPLPWEFLFMTICIPASGNAHIRTITGYMLQHCNALERSESTGCRRLFVNRILYLIFNNCYSDKENQG